MCAPVRGAALVSAMALIAAAPPTAEQMRDATRAHAAEMAAERSAQESAQTALALEQQLGQARAAAAQKLRAAEDELAHATASIADLAARREGAEAALKARAAVFTPMLPVIERLSLYPAESLLAVPMLPEQAVRGVLVLGGITQTLAAEATALQAEQAALTSVSDEIRRALPGLAQAQAEQARLSTELDTELARTRAQRVAAEAVAMDAARRAAVDAGTVDGLRGALARIEEDRHSAEQRSQEGTAAADRLHTSADGAVAHRRQEALARPPESALGAADPRQAVVADPGAVTAVGPVAGRIVRAFGAATEAGPASGVSYQPPPKARVTAPCGGRVAFAGPFRSFGLLMIVDCGGGYHAVLSGLDRLDAQVGQPVQRGDPVGVMPTWDPRAGPSGAPQLYFELRKDGVPVNPAPFLRARS